MPDFPVGGVVPLVHLSSWSALGPAVLWAAIASLAPSSQSWSGANRAIYVPVDLPCPFTVYKGWVYNGANAAGNCDVGIYDRKGTRIVSSGSVARSGTNQLQDFELTDTRVIGPGCFYLACAFSSTTGAVFRISPAVPIETAGGLAQQASALPLPATATFAAMTSAQVPLFGVAGRALAA